MRQVAAFGKAAVRAFIKAIGHVADLLTFYETKSINRNCGKAKAELTAGPKAEEQHPAASAFARYARQHAATAKANAVAANKNAALLAGPAAYSDAAIAAANEAKVKTKTAYDLAEAAWAKAEAAQDISAYATVTAARDNAYWAYEAADNLHAGLLAAARYAATPIDDAALAAAYGAMMSAKATYEEALAACEKAKATYDEAHAKGQTTDGAEKDATLAATIAGVTGMAAYDAANAACKAYNLAAVDYASVVAAFDAAKDRAAIKRSKSTERLD
jgi:hypothetical protein